MLRRGPWSLNDWMCIVQKWTLLLSDDEIKYILFWVQMKGIPLHFLTKRMVKSIGERMGAFIETDFAGDGAVLVDYIRVQIPWNVEAPLRFKKIFEFGDKTSVLKFRYEKLWNFCSSCV